MRTLKIVVVLFIFFLSHPTFAQFKDYFYPYPVKYKAFKIEGKTLRMAYMDIAPAEKSSHLAVVLLHGGLASSGYWKEIRKNCSIL